MFDVRVGGGHVPRNVAAGGWREPAQPSRVPRPGEWGGEGGGVSRWRARLCSEGHPPTVANSEVSDLCVCGGSDGPARGCGERAARVRPPPALQPPRSFATSVGPLASPDRVAPQPLFATSPRPPFPHQHLAFAKGPLPLPTAAFAVVWCCHIVCRLGDGRSGGSTRARASSCAPSPPLERPPFPLLAASVKRPPRRPPTRCCRRGSPFARDAALPPRNDGRADEPWAS